MTPRRVGIFGGAPKTHDLLRSALADTLPHLLVAECWAPTRDELEDPARCRGLAEKVAAADIDLLVVALGKPRQEYFLAEYGLLTGVRVAVAFGAAIDFLTGQVHRAPRHVRHAGLEWLWRLVQEPQRLAKRYLVAGPPGAAALLRDSRVLWTDGLAPDSLPQPRKSARAVVPGPASGQGEWSGVERRLAARRSGCAATRMTLGVIPEQRHDERRARTDRRVRVVAEV